MHPSPRSLLPKALLTALCTVWLAACGTGPRVSPKTPDLTLPALLPLASQIEMREGWLIKRHDMILPLLRKHGLGYKWGRFYFLGWALIQEIRKEK